MKVPLTYCFAAAFGLGVLSSPRAMAQDVIPLPSDPPPLQPRVPFKLYSFDGKDAVSQGSRSPRLQITGMQAGFLINPLGLDDDDVPAFGGEARPGTGDPDVIQLNIGTYNPCFEMRRPGDPGSVGYYKVHSQLQVLDAGSTSFTLNLQAYTPAGMESGGVANGPTFFVPAVACFQDLGNGAALQTYFGQNIQANSRWVDRTNSNFHYGMAVQCAVPGTNTTSDQGVFLFFEALGRYRYDTTQPGAQTNMWEFVPGVQMRINSNCWMNLAASRYNFLSCSWKY